MVKMRKSGIQRLVRSEKLLKRQEKKAQLALETEKYKQNNELIARLQTRQLKKQD